MTIITDLDFFTVVYLITDAEQLPRQITEIRVMPACPGYSLVYQLSCGTETSQHFRNEFAREPNTVNKLIS